MTTIWSGDGARNCQEISEKDKRDSGCQIFKCNITVKIMWYWFKNKKWGGEINEKDRKSTSRILYYVCSGKA